MWSVYGGLATTIGLKDTTHIVHLLNDCGAPTNKVRTKPRVHPARGQKITATGWWTTKKPMEAGAAPAGIADPLAVAFSRQYTRGVSDSRAYNRSA